jgi:lantibiotic modifying enzyme
MKKEELIRNLKYTMKKHENDIVSTFGTNISLMCKDVLNYLEQDPCEMTTEEYRQRMIQAFHNADCDELLAICVRPMEKEFEHLEWLLKNHYKKEPRTGHWILQPSNKEQDERDFIWWKCSKCGQVIYSETEQDRREFHAFCGRCGAKMVETQEGSEE